MRREGSDACVTLALRGNPSRDPVAMIPLSAYLQVMHSLIYH